MSQSVTLKDIAREANLSVGAVSKALAGYPHISEATRKRVLRISSELNYRPRAAQRRTAGQQRRVKLAFTESSTTLMRISSTLLPALMAAAQEQDVRLELGQMKPADAQWWDQLEANLADMVGVLILGWLDRVTAEDAARRANRPCVVIGDVKPHSSAEPIAVHRVDTDKLAMACYATEALIEAGHRRIGFFCSPYPPGGWNDQWLTGYRLALMRAGLPDDPLIRPVLESRNRDEVGAEAARYMGMLDEPPTAYVVPTVRGAARFRETMSQLGHPIKPDRLVMGGHLDEAAEYGMERFPIVSTPIEEISSRAIDLLVRLIEGADLPPAQTLVPFHVHNLPAKQPESPT